MRERARDRVHKKQSPNHICRRWKPAINMSGNKVQVPHSIHTRQLHTWAFTQKHTQTHTLLFRVQNPASRGNNEMSALKRLSGDNRQASTSPPSFRCRIWRLRSKGAAGPRLPNCRSQGRHSNGDRRAIHSSAVSRAGRRGAVNSMGVLKVRNGSF